ncbi:MAG: PA14 domain-containing protein, partial [Lentisphaeraceae bacterium]|nr:PA14 domain-containing protein [Lentisphaeraceae bacterium]
MKYLLLTLFMMGFFSSISVFGSAENETPPPPKTHCCNYHTKKCYIIESDEGDCDSCGCSISVVEVECGESEHPDTDTYTVSKVETLSYNYMHDVVEYEPKNPDANCKSCSGGNVGESTLKLVALHRYHRFRQMSDRGSFGPGIFSNFDNYFTLYMSGSTPRVDMFFGADLSMRRYFKQGSAFVETFSRSSKKLEIRKADGTPTTVISEADHAVIESFKGEIYKFEIFEIDEFTKGGRFVEYTDRNGFKVVLDYVYDKDAEISDSSEKYKINTITDDTNRTLTFSYLGETRNGMWVVSSVALPNGSSIQYNYGTEANDHLSSVIYPDGTSSTFTSEVQSDGQTKVTIFEAGEKGKHRNKCILLDSNFNGGAIGRDGVQYFNQASLLVNKIEIGDEGEQESAFEIYQNPNHHNNRRVFQGGNQLKSVNIATASYYKEWEKPDPNSFFDGFQGLKTEESSTKGDWKFYLANAQMRPPVMTDKHNVKYKYVYNSSNRLTKKIYEDNTFERKSYNEFNQVTRHRDRLGRVTHWEYDSRGNLTKKIVGLKAEQFGTAGDEVSGLLCRVYDHTNTVLPTNFESLDPVETLSVPNLDLDVTDREDTYALLFTGEIEITNAGDYTFFISSDDGSKLYIDGVEVIDNDGLHGLRELSNEVPVTLDAGKHSIRVEFFEKYGAQQLFLKYQGPDSAEEKVTVPDSVYSHFTVEEELAETDVTTPDTAERNLTYYPAGHANQYLLHTEEDFN